MGDRPDLPPLPSPLKPSPNQLFAVTVEGSRIPMHAPKLIDAIEKLEALFIGGGYSVECLGQT